MSTPAKPKIITFRATPEQAVLIDEQAARLGVTRTDLILRSLLQPTQVPVSHAPCVDHPEAGAVLVAGDWMCNEDGCPRTLR